MKTILLFITLFGFLQSAFLPLNLVLVVLIARSFNTEDRDNLFLAFFGGLVLGFLTQVNLGYYPVVFIFIVKLAGLLRRLPVSFNLLMVLIFGAILILLAAFVDSLFIKLPFSVYPHLIEIVLVLPVYALIKMWEGRFTAKSHMKLKVR